MLIGCCPWFVRFCIPWNCFLFTRLVNVFDTSDASREMASASDRMFDLSVIFYQIFSVLLDQQDWLLRHTCSPLFRLMVGICLLIYLYYVMISNLKYRLLSILRGREEKEKKKKDQKLGNMYPLYFRYKFRHILSNIFRFTRSAKLTSQTHMLTTVQTDGWNLFIYLFIFIR